MANTQTATAAEAAAASENRAHQYANAAETARNTAVRAKTAAEAAAASCTCSGGSSVNSLEIDKAVAAGIVLSNLLQDNTDNLGFMIPILKDLADNATDTSGVYDTIVKNGIKSYFESIKFAPSQVGALTNNFSTYTPVSNQFRKADSTYYTYTSGDYVMLSFDIAEWSFVLSVYDQGNVFQAKSHTLDALNTSGASDYIIFSNSNRYNVLSLKTHVAADYGTLQSYTTMYRLGKVVEIFHDNAESLLSPQTSGTLRSENTISSRAEVDSTPDELDMTINHDIDSL